MIPFTWREIRYIKRAMKLADAELHNMIATCPDVIEYADHIDQLEAERDFLKKLRRKVTKWLVEEKKETYWSNHD